MRETKSKEQPSLEEVKKAVYAHIKAHPGVKTTDLIFNFGVDPEILVEALNQLQSEGKVYNKNVSAPRKSRSSSSK